MTVQPASAEDRASLILRTVTRFMLPLLLLFSVFLLLRGHNDPGGGFSGGLVAASAFTLYALAFGVDATRRALPIEPRSLIGVGLLAAVASGAVGVFAGEPWMTGRWLGGGLPDWMRIELGTPLLFDVGVYLVVLGMGLTIILPLAEEE